MQIYDSLATKIYYAHLEGFPDSRGDQKLTRHEDGIRVNQNFVLLTLSLQLYLQSHDVRDLHRPASSCRPLVGCDLLFGIVSLGGGGGELALLGDLLQDEVEDAVVRPDLQGMESQT